MIMLDFLRSNAFYSIKSFSFQLTRYAQSSYVRISEVDVALFNEGFNLRKIMHWARLKAEIININ